MNPSSGVGDHAPPIVVVGGGFGGLWAARRLARLGRSVLLLDRNNYHTFFPLLYQVAAAELGPTSIAYPIRGILRGQERVEFRMLEVTGVDLDGRCLRTRVGSVPYRALILAPGSEPHFFGVPGAAEHAFALRTMGDALPLRAHVLDCFERASLESDTDIRRALLTFAVVGGGPTGVEFAGALAELVRGPLRRDFPGLGPGGARVVLLEAAGRVLASMSDRLGAYAIDRLQRKGVEVRLGARVQGVDAHGVSLAEHGELATRTVVWTAGVRGDPRLAEWGLPVGPGGLVRVTPSLSVPGHPEVYVVGDAALAQDEDGSPLPQVAPVAIQMAEHAAEDLHRRLDGGAPRSFRYRDPGMLAVIGRNAAVARIGGREFKGFPAWILWLVIHIARLIGFRNRALVLVNWAWNYLTFGRSVRLILPRARGS